LKKWLQDHFGREILAAQTKGHNTTQHNRGSGLES
jgi:hypothetical protein